MCRWVTTRQLFVCNFETGDVSMEHITEAKALEMQCHGKEG